MLCPAPNQVTARHGYWASHRKIRATSGLGMVVAMASSIRAVPLGGGNEAVLLMDNPGQLLGPEVPDLSGFSFGGEPVRWLWILPITERERQLAKERGATSLINQQAAQRRSWVVGD